MRAPSATTNVAVRRNVDDQLELLVARQVGRRGGDALDQRAGVERLRAHLEPPGLALGQREHVAQVGVEQERGAADATDQLVVGIGTGPAPHRQDVEGGDDALERGAKLVADFGEEGAAGERCIRAAAAKSGPFLLDGANVVDAADERSEEQGNAEQHEKNANASAVSSRQYSLVRSERRAGRSHDPREIHRPQAVSNPAPHDDDEQKRIEKGKGARIEREQADEERADREQETEYRNIPSAGRVQFPNRRYAKVHSR